jgi:hypothetical protein
MKAFMIVRTVFTLSITSSSVREIFKIARIRNLLNYLNR